MIEKIEEIKARKRLLAAQPLVFEAKMLSNENLIEEFTPVSIKGTISKGNEDQIKVFKTIDGEPGFKILKPLSLTTSNKNSKSKVFVDLGWISMNDIDKFESNETSIEIIGIVYYGDKKVRGKLEKNDLKNKKFITMHVDELVKASNEPQNITDKLMIKAIDLTDIDRSRKNTTNFTIDPKLPKTEDLLVWVISPETHRSYYRFWAFATAINWLSNIYVWLSI